MTMTAEDINSRIASKSSRIRELTITAAALEQSLTSTRNAIAAAIAGGTAGSGSARETVRSNSEELAGVRDAIDQLTRDRVSLEAQLKKTQAREARERADQSASEATRAIDATEAAIGEAVEKILGLESDLKETLNAANGADQLARQLNGQDMAISPRVGLHQKPGLEELLAALDKYNRRAGLQVRIA